METLKMYVNLTGRYLSSSNGGKYGVDRIDYQVKITRYKKFELVITDGFKLSIVKYTDSLNEVKKFLRQGK